MNIEMTTPGAGVSPAPPKIEPPSRHNATDSVAATCAKAVPRSIGATPTSRIRPSADATKARESTEAPKAHAQTQEMLEAQRRAREESKDEESKNIQVLTAQLNEVMTAFDKRIRFRIDKELEEPFVQVINVDTGEVIRTIPSEEMLDLMARMRDALGMILDVEI